MPDLLRRLTSFDELYAASGHDPFILHEVPASFAGPAFILGAMVEASSGAIVEASVDALAFVRRSRSRHVGLVAIGPAPGMGSRSDPAMGSGLDRLLGALAAADVVADLGMTDISVPYESRALLDKHFLVGPGGDWDWMWTTTAPDPVPHEARLVDLSGEDLGDVVELLATTSPQTHARPGERDEQWIGIRDTAGALVACGSMERNGAGRPHLSGIAVDPAHRGGRLGRAVTASLTRRAVASDGVCTLGMYSDNEAARRVYHGLGYHTAYIWASRSLLSG